MAQVIVLGAFQEGVNWVDMLVESLFKSMHEQLKKSSWYPHLLLPTFTGPIRDRSEETMQHGEIDSSLHRKLEPAALEEILQHSLTTECYLMMSIYWGMTKRQSFGTTFRPGVGESVSEASTSHS